MASRYSSDRNPETSRERRFLIGWWRVGITTVVALLFCSIGALVVTNLQLSRELKQAHQQLGSLSSSVSKSQEASSSNFDKLKKDLETTRQTSLKGDDLDKLRDELEQSIGQTTSRVTLLETEQKSIQTVIEQTAQSVVYLQGAYQLVHPDRNVPLRYAGLDEDGEPLMMAPGIPKLSPDGEGPLYNPMFTGTGFVVSADGLIMTNRHVALPWELDTLSTVLVERGLRPEITRMWGFLPGRTEPFDVTLLKASDNADLALLKREGETDTVPALAISQKAVNPGTEILVLGYPTGLRALMARAGEAYSESENLAYISDYWELAAQLAEDKLIAPLASRGIVGQKTKAHIVYDAETTSGGSGGPVLTRDGQVVAVNTAILPDFDGSNLGVPANQIVELIQASRDAN